MPSRQLSGRGFGQDSSRTNVGTSDWASGLHAGIPITTANVTSTTLESLMVRFPFRAFRDARAAEPADLSIPRTRFAVPSEFMDRRPERVTMRRRNLLPGAIGMNRRQQWMAFGLAIVVAAGAHIVTAQQGDPQPMSFFITSEGPGDGANLGGLAGADAHCQSLAAAAGRGDSTWRAYLSTQGPNAVNARDRIGSGPWYAHGGRRRIATNLAMLHGDTLELARAGISFGKGIALTEQGNPVPGLGDRPNQHDILTGTQTDGRAYARRRRPHLQQLDQQRRGRLGAGRAPRQAGRPQRIVELGASEPRLRSGEPGGDGRCGLVLLFRQRLIPAVGPAGSRW